MVKSLKLTKQHRRKIVKKLGAKATNLQDVSSKHIKQYVTGRTKKLANVKRFVFGWLVLVLGISIASAYNAYALYKAGQVSTGKNGGVYTEGMVGDIKTLNPIFGSGSVHESISRLMFNGLMRIDENGDLVPDLAQKITIDDSNKNYTLQLRKDVRWHDGKAFTADDVVYTIKAIQDPATNSIDYASWKGVEVKSTGNYEVIFTLPAPFAPFMSSLTQPILPKHLLAKTANNQLRSANYNSAPVGTGPFMFQARRSEGRTNQIDVTRNENYFRSQPKLKQFVLKVYSKDSEMLEALKRDELTAAVDINPQAAAQFEGSSSIRLTNISLNNGVFAFFKTNSDKLSDVKVRQALSQAIDRNVVLQQFGGLYAPLKSPLLDNQLGFSDKYLQQTDKTKAAALLDEAGWKKVGDIREKSGEKLILTMSTLDTPEYTMFSNELKRQWQEIGVGLTIQSLNTEMIQQNALSTHSYDVLLYGIALGSDPDVYAYWHSSQARPGGFNFSEWKSPRADSSLEYGRTRIDKNVRAARYKTFLDEWINQAPAVALYQPHTIYAYHQSAHQNLISHASSIADRLSTVEEWTANTRLVRQTP